MKKKQNKISISILKYNALKLRANYQLPFKLTQYIVELKADDDINKFIFLSHASEHYLRVKGYYKKYPVIEKQYNTIIASEYEKIK